ncbi:rab-GTPase-TBC domain-containing protein [Tricladium varicosporioides]|nr:rab-GTPase-TBC domain-containing protein [Hymenoscyphus varicosporioides]
MEGTARNDGEEKEVPQEVETAALDTTSSPIVEVNPQLPMLHDSMVTVRELREDETEIQEDSPRITMMDVNGNEVESPSGSEESAMSRSRRGSESSESLEEEVNWEELEKTEELEPRSESSDDSTALLLARLEQENNLIASNPKAGIAKVKVVEQRRRTQSRPPSIQHLKRLVNGPTPPALRYSMIPAPPMTDLEFYAALVQDYARTAQYLPTLLSKKIRSGIPPPLRGVVWQSMSGARDRLLEDQFDRLCGESSPYEGIIGKDLGRSFPGVEMFRDPEGDGQRMLGRVLKCFSLYDHKIGYCQGLGFLVGPLLMHMGDKQAFCVLVRLMEHYDLRSCFLPDLSGLHVRIYQFKELLKQHLPELSTHLDVLQIEPAYVSQWFLSFFAVTCPLPMLFRIYDVIFAEGASETIMRVALSLMRKNEQKILACTEFEDVMQLLLSRGLWDVYHYNADEFVNDFVSLTGVVTRDSLQALEASFKATGSVDAANPSEQVGSAASRFLGRLWSGSNSSTKSVNLSPGLSAPSRPISFLRRSPSKQSIASTLNSMEGGASDSMMSQSTDATSVSRDSSNADMASLRTQSVVNLHSQIEDLLMALSEMQRDHAILATQLQREREEREEDRQAKASQETVKSSESDETDDDSAVDVEATNETETSTVPEPTDLSGLLDIVEERFGAPAINRRSSMMQTRSQLRDELTRSKEQLIIECSKTQEFSRQISEHQQEISNLKDQLRESHNHARHAHTEKQRLEKQIHDLRTKAKSAASTPDGNKDNETEWPSRTSNSGGLREFRLGRTNSNRSVAPTYNKRTSSLNMAAVMSRERDESPNHTREPSTASSTREKADVDNDALVLELVQAKTAEAVAKQEAEEAKAKLESLKKMLNLGSGGGAENPTIALHRSTPSQSTIERSATALGSYLTKGAAKENVAPASATVPATGGGFWGGWGKRAVSTSSTIEKVAVQGS